MLYLLIKLRPSTSIISCICAGFKPDSSETEYLHCKPGAIHAVRGPLTNKKIMQQGLPAAKVLGDPGSLCALLFPEVIPTSHKYGLIPHYVDKEDPRVLAAAQRDDVLLIDSQQEPARVIRKLKQCRHILSSSLHGLICADAFDIPAVYVKFSDRVFGSGFKFADYFLSCGRSELTPYVVGESLVFSHALSRLEAFKNRIDLNALRECFPIR